MDFEIITTGKSKNVEEEYSISEQCFDCYPTVNVDISIAIAYLNLGVDSEDMCVKCLWGFSPRESWKEAKLIVPTAEEGELKLIGDYEAGLTWRIDTANMWESYIDKSSEWYCIGKLLLEKGDRAVKIMKNMIVVVDNANLLKAIWVKPKFV